MSSNNEFLRQDPKKNNRKLIYDLTNLIIPVIILIIGIFLSTQKFAEMMGYNPSYCDYPIYILKHKIGNYPAGYPIFNPIVILLTMFRNPFDHLVQDAIAAASVPGEICAGIAILFWLVISVIRSRGFNKNDNLYGTARWGTVKDLKKFGLCEESGIVLGQQFTAKTETEINKKGNFSIKVKKTAPLICHSGTNHTLVIAPTRGGKGISIVDTTLCSYGTGKSFREVDKLLKSGKRWKGNASMIIFDPKGELYNQTAGFRAKFSRVIKFSPVQMETACFNPLEEVELDENAFRDLGTVLTNLFQKEKGGDSNSDFFDNNARDLLTGVIFHVLSAVDENNFPLYKQEDKCIAGVLRIFARAASGEDEEGNPLPAGEALLDEMISSKHLDKYGKESDYIHGIILDVAMSAKQQHEKVRSDIMQTVQSKLNLFRDPFIRNCTQHSDFKISDFYNTEEPISLYLTVPFGDIDRIMPVFQLMIDFILRKLSSGEMKAGEKEKSLHFPIQFLIDEFPTLNLPFLHKCLGILAGYGVRFMLICQAYEQLVKIYGKENTFIDNCRYMVIYSTPNKDDQQMFSQMMGKRSVTKENLSVSGSRFSVALNNLNTSSQEVATDLINPDEIGKLPYTDMIIMCHNMPPYMGKKTAFFGDERFKSKVFFEDVDSGEVKTGFKAPYTQEEINEQVKSLPSQIKRKEILKIEQEQIEKKNVETEIEKEKESFDPIAFLETYQADENGENVEWDAPFDIETNDGEPPPKKSEYTLEDFDSEGDVVYTNSNG